MLDSFAGSGCNDALLAAPDWRSLQSLLGLWEAEELVPLAQLPIHPTVVALAAGPALERIAGAHAAGVGLYLGRRSTALATLSELDSLSELEIQQRTPPPAPPLAVKIRSMLLDLAVLLLLLLVSFSIAAMLAMLDKKEAESRSRHHI